MPSARVQDKPLFTEIFDPAADFVPPSGATFVSGVSGEERSAHVQELRQRSQGVRFVEIVNQGVGEVTLEEGEELGLRNQSSLKSWWNTLTGPTYLDITGLAHDVWAPLIAAALRERLDLRVVYVEPLKYRFNVIRTEGELFDLTKGFLGVQPLPGFASLAEPDEQDFKFIPLLGFEGPRFARMLEVVQPAPEMTVPVIGVPGFQPEFVFHAYLGNRLPLQTTSSWRSVRFSTANCPFDLFYLLEEIASQGDNFLKVAPIGTKPHGLGAILFAIANPDRVEILYDYPVRREERTEGKARLLVYYLRGLQSRLAP